MPATALRCTNCETELELEAVGSCPRCFAPLVPVYDPDELVRTVTRESIAAGPSSIWRYAPLLPVAPPREQLLAPGLTPLVRAPRLAEAVGVRELWLKLDTANPTHSFKDRVVAVACAKAQELGLRTLACSSTGNLANAVAARAAAEGLEAAVFCPVDLEPEKLVATAVYGATVYAVDGSYDDCSRLTVELSFELPWAFVNVGLRTYYAEGSKTLAFEIAEQLGWRTPDAVVAPIASGALFSKVHRGFDELLDLGLAEGSLPRLYGGQAEGCSPVATAFAEEQRVVPVRPRTVARSLAIGSPADGDAAVRSARESDGAVYAVAEDEVGENMALLAERAGIFGETAAGVTLGALLEAVRRGEVGVDDEVVLLVTGDGLKTPEPVAARLQPVEIEADADTVLERLGVTA
ncbi:MAG: threonine synthase [Gaiellaceae bacterium]